MRSEFTHYTKPKRVPEVWSEVVSELVKLRNEKQWSQEELADRIGCNTSLIHKWETFKRVPSGFMLSCWLEALNGKIEIKKR